MKFSQYFGNNVKVLDIDLSEYFNEQALSKDIDEQNIEGVFIHQDFRSAPLKTDLEFLDSIKDKNKIRKIGLLVNLEEESNIERLYSFKNLDELTLLHDGKEEFSIDLSYFRHLSNLVINGQFKLRGLDKIELKKLLLNECKKINIESYGKTIESLKIIHSKPFKIESFISLSNLKNLELTQTQIFSLNGIDDFKNLETLKICYCPKLTDISAVVSCSKLKTLEFENDKKIEDFSCLGAMRNLKGLIISNCGDLPSLKFIESMGNLKFFSFVDTNIQDGDLTPCLRLECVGTMDKRHYNLKSSELPHNKKFAFRFL